MPRAYQENHRYFHQAYETGRYPWSRTPCVQVGQFLEQILKDARAHSFLDLGCGEGANVRMAAQAGLYAVGLDREWQEVERATIFAHQEGLTAKAQFLVSDGLALPFAPGSFDIVLDHGCLYHLRKSDWGTYQANVDSVLRPRGFYILEVFSTEHHGYGHVPRSGWHIKAGAYRRFFTREDIESFWRDAFDILRLEKKRGEVAGDWHALMRRRS